MSIKEEYSALLESGDLKMLLPKATGDWETDKNKFTIIYQTNQEILKGYDNENSKEGPPDLV
jgi:hypothetical protein